MFRYGQTTLLFLIYICGGSILASAGDLKVCCKHDDLAASVCEPHAEWNSDDGRIKLIWDKTGQLVELQSMAQNPVVNPDQARIQISQTVLAERAQKELDGFLIRSSRSPDALTALIGKNFDERIEMEAAFGKSIAKKCKSPPLFRVSCRNKRNCTGTYSTWTCADVAASVQLTKDYAMPARGNLERSIKDIGAFLRADALGGSQVQITKDFDESTATAAVTWAVVRMAGANAKPSVTFLRDDSPEKDPKKSAARTRMCDLPLDKAQPFITKIRDRNTSIMLGSRKDLDIYYRAQRLIRGN